MMKKIYHKVGMRAKLNIGYMTMMIVILTASFLIYIQLSEKQVEEKMFKADQQQVFLIKSTIQNIVDRVEMVSADISVNPMVQNALKERSMQSYYIYERDINGYLNNILNRDLSIASIYIIDINNYIYNVDSDQREVYFTDDLLESLNTQELIALKGKSKWTIQANMFIQDGGNHLIVSRAIKSIDDFQTIGYVMITIKNNILKDIYKRFSNNGMYSYVLEDEKQRTISFPHNVVTEEIKNMLCFIPYSVDEYYKKNIRNSNHHFIKVPIESIGWSLSSTFIYDNNIHHIELVFIIVLLFNAIFSIIGSRLINSIILQPLESISRSINKIRDGDLTTRFKINQNKDEINQLSVGLNIMMDKINLLLEELNNEHKIKRKLELDLLVHQVKPHFLYNTLNAASAYISIGRREEAFHILRTLASYYRSCLSSGKEIISIKEELELLKNYVDIMNIRMNKLFNISYKVDDKVLDCTILKLILQPLVENSMNHGISQLDTVLNIECLINKVQQKDLILISIQDDGVGMSEATIQRILRGEDLNRKSGFGLKSIIQRLSIHYKIKDINDLIQIESVENEYTKISLYIPIQR